MTASELARQLGVTRQNVSKLRKKGMPIDSLEAAQKWRAVHAPPRGKSFVLPATETAPSPFDDSFDRAGRARAAEEYAYAVLRDAAASRDIRLTGRALRDFLVSAKRAAEAEQAAVAAGVQTGELLRASDILKAFDDVIRPFLHRCRMAQENEACRWYVTIDGAAKDMVDTLQMFGSRLIPGNLFKDENKAPQN
jgi:transcriptional regulator with XRE-family HTH domain